MLHHPSVPVRQFFYTLTMIILNQDCKIAIRELIANGVQVDSIVTDPPYELGFMGKSWDKTGIAYDVELWQLCLEILKPGGHLLAFGGSRTYHRMACAIEDAGFDIRDQIMWVYGSGFPKSLDVSKAIDKAKGLEREKKIYPLSEVGNFKNREDTRPWIEQAKKTGFHEVVGDDPVSIEAQKWQGWGTALKPAHEPIVMARKPLDEKTIAANVLKHGTGAINIDGCRVGTTRGVPASHSKTNNKIYGGFPSDGRNPEELNPNIGRFPANLIHDGSDEVEAEFAKYGVRKSGHKKIDSSEMKSTVYGKFKQNSINEFNYTDGSASRFYYCAKASSKERNGSKHPTVKPLALMRYLCRLVTPAGGTVLDPFAGSGTTGQSAKLEEFDAILIEKESEYIADIKERIA